MFNKLFEENYPKVLRLCKGYFNGDKYLAHDASQEIFMKVWEHLDTFRNDANVKTWLYRISVNTCLVYIRKASYKKKILYELILYPETENYSFEIEQKLEKMYDCINKLDPSGKLIILMVLEGLKYNEIAEVVGVTEETLRVKIHRIKKKLTQCVQL